MRGITSRTIAGTGVGAGGGVGDGVALAVGVLVAVGVTVAVAVRVDVGVGVSVGASPPSTKPQPRLIEASKTTVTKAMTCPPSMAALFYMLLRPSTRPTLEMLKDFSPQT
jgi:hypothetical protein